MSESEAARPAPDASKLSAAPVSASGFDWRAVTIVGTVLVAGAGALYWVLAPPVKLDEREFLSMATAGRFDAAEELARRHAGQSDRARFLLAQMLLERPDRDSTDSRADDAAEALELLDQLREKQPAPSKSDQAIHQLYRGKALRTLSRWDAAESAWRDALALDQRVPEAGLELLSLYSMQSRKREGRELALMLFKVEPDFHDRAVILLALLWDDAIRPDPISQVPLFERVADAEPTSIKSQVALGLALARSSEHDRAIEVLRRAVAENETSDLAWEGLLGGLEAARRLDELVATFDKLPAEFRDSPRFKRFAGQAHEHRMDWEKAQGAYEAAAEFDATDFETRVRLARVLRLGGNSEKADVLDAQIARQREAMKGLMPLHEEANATPSLGTEPHVELCERIALAYEAMDRAAEAAAWREVGKGNRRP